MDFEQMYRDYVMNREGLLLHKFEHGFILYKEQEPNALYIADMYTIPEMRSKGIMLEQYQKFEIAAKQQEYSELYVSVWLKDKNKDRNIACTLKSGYKIYSSDGEMIYLKKDL